MLLQKGTENHMREEVGVRYCTYSSVLHTTYILYIEYSRHFYPTIRPKKMFSLVPVSIYQCQFMCDPNYFIKKIIIIEKKDFEKKQLTKKQKFSRQHAFKIK